MPVYYGIIFEAVFSLEGWKNSIWIYGGCSIQIRHRHTLSLEDTAFQCYMVLFMVADFLQSAGHHINQQCLHPSKFVHFPKSITKNPSLKLMDADKGLIKCVQIAWWAHMHCCLSVCSHLLRGICAQYIPIFYMTIPTHTVTPPPRLSQEVNDARPSLNNLRENLLTKWPMTIDISQIKRQSTTSTQLSANAHWSQTHRQWPEPRSNGCAWERWRTLPSALSPCFAKLCSR